MGTDPLGLVKGAKTTFTESSIPCAQDSAYSNEDGSHPAEYCPNGWYLTPGATTQEFYPNNADETSGFLHQTGISDVEASYVLSLVHPGDQPPRPEALAAAHGAAVAAPAVEAIWAVDQLFLAAAMPGLLGGGGELTSLGLAGEGGIGILSKVPIGPEPLPVDAPSGFSTTSVRKANYPTRERLATRERLEVGATDATGTIRCQNPNCAVPGGRVLQSGEGTPQHNPQLVETHNQVGWNTDQPTRNQLYNDTATGLHCIECQKIEGGATKARYRTDTGPNYKPRPKRPPRTGGGGG